MNNETMFHGAVVIFLLLCSAFFSASETAYSSLNKSRLKTYAERGFHWADLAQKLAENYDELLSSVLIGNNLVNIALAGFGTVLLVSWLGPKLGSSISIVAITLVVLIFGEITPKCIAKDNPERFALFAAPLLQLCVWTFKPLNLTFKWWKVMLQKLFRLEKREKVSPEELLMLVDEVQQDGGINKNEGELLRNAIEFSDVEAKDIATPRVRLGAVPLNATSEEIAKAFEDTKFSRLLVFHGTIDNIVGVVHMKNFFTSHGVCEKPLTDIMSPTVFVPTTEKIYSVFRKLQHRQTQVAVVLDEFGGTYGIVTTEDVLEELVGEIWDEMDNVSEPFRRMSENTVRVDASVDLDDFCDYFHVEIDSELVTLSGWITDCLNSLPRRGDHFKYQNLEITVLKIERRCVSIIEVKTTA